MEPGIVFKWNNFPYPRFGGQIKDRWFIYLGNSGVLNTPIIAYICTTTTQLSDFEKGGKRNSHKHFCFKKSNYPFFEADCILDAEEAAYPIENSFLVEREEINIKGRLDNNTMREIYNMISLSKHYSKRILLDIHSSLNNLGITGLRKPK